MSLGGRETLGKYVTRDKMRISLIIIFLGVEDGEIRFYSGRIIG